MTATSFVMGPTEPALLNQTIGEALDRAATLWPDAEALVSVHQSRRLSWSELAARVDAVAAGLLALGIRRGDRVGIWAPNCEEWVIVQFATARVGIIQVNINPAYRASELAHTLRAVGLKALICAARFKTSDYVAIMESVVPEIREAVAGQVVSAAFPSLSAVVHIGGTSRIGWIDFEELAGLGTSETCRLRDHLRTELSCDDPINIQFTSGTTGAPKGATLSHRNILNNGNIVGFGMGLREGDRMCIPVPLYHCFGMVMGNLACVAHGATMIYPSDGFDAASVLTTIETERCTALHGVPTMFIAELEHPDFDTFDLSSLRTGLMAGSPCPVDVMRKVVNRMNMSDIGIAYGMTETSPVSFQTSIYDSLARRVSTIGTVQPHLEVKLIDTTGSIVPRGTMGELCTRGYSVMLGYWGETDRTIEVLDQEGWMHTGDLATIDKEGYGNIVGRIKDMIIRGGENIYPREIEDFLFKHPGIEDVQVVGVPDQRFGEEVCAWIKLRSGHSFTVEEIQNYCGSSIAHFKVPKYIRLVESFPMTISGKVQKYVIREKMIRDLGLLEVKTA